MFCLTWALSEDSPARSILSVSIDTGSGGQVRGLSPGPGWVFPWVGTLEPDRMPGSGSSSSAQAPAPGRPAGSSKRSPTSKPGKIKDKKAAKSDKADKLKKKVSFQVCQSPQHSSGQRWLPRGSRSPTAQTPRRLNHLPQSLLIPLPQPEKQQPRKQVCSTSPFSLPPSPRLRII